MDNHAYINEPEAIVAAAWDGLAELVERLIDNGADINIQDEAGQTALIAASDQGYSGIVELLLKRGADSDIRDKDADSALDVARFKDHSEIVKLLIAHGAVRRSGPSAKGKMWREDGDAILDDIAK